VLFLADLHNLQNQNVLQHGKLRSKCSCTRSYNQFSRIKDRIDETLEQLKIETDDEYGAVGILSLRWASDNTGASLDILPNCLRIRCLYSTAWFPILVKSQTMETRLIS
jgi:hypothetical protein